MKRLGAAVVLGLLAAVGGARAETSGISAGGFTVTHATEVDGEPERVWQAFTQLGRWWSSTHTWSGQASNLSLDPQAGGCWCERWGQGQSVMHGQVLWSQPGATLRVHAWLGPLQEQPAAGVLTFATARRDGRTRMRLTYRVAGAPDGALEKLAKPVDDVLGEQFRRLKRFVETGSAD